MYWLLEMQRKNPKYASHLQWGLFTLRDDPNTYYIKVYNKRYWIEKKFNGRPQYIQVEATRLKCQLLQEIIAARRG